MLIIGITGSIGVGKTYVSNLFSKKGAPVYNCDDRVKIIMESNSDLKKSICDEFGNDCFLENGKRNVEYLSKIVFTSQKNRDTINDIVGNYVKIDFDIFYEKNKSCDYIIIESAILFESNMKDKYKIDYVICVDAPLRVRIERIKKRNPELSDNDIKNRINSQLPRKEKLRLSDKIILNYEDGVAEYSVNLLDLSLRNNKQL